MVIAVTAWWVRRSLSDLGYAILTIAFIALLVGLTTPILSLEASKELPILGDTVFQFQSKGVLSTISALEQNGNLWLARSGTPYPQIFAR